MKLVSRKEWDARSPRHRNKRGMNAVSTYHWNGPTLTIRGKKTWGHEYCASMVRATQNFHMDQRGWSDIAYNFVICQHGYVFEGRGINYINGANGTNNGNRTSHAIMSLSGPGNPFPVAEKVAFRECLSHIANHTSAPDNRAIGHRDHKSTECPGDARFNWVHAGMPGTEHLKQEVDDIVFFHSHKERVEFVEKSYLRIAGREVESEETLNMWVWFIAHSPAAALDLITALQNESRVVITRRVEQLT